MKTIETQFKRIESKYLVSKDKLDYLMHDLKTFLVEDDYPTSAITNVYFDTDDFQIIQDSIAKKHLREKIRMRSYHSQTCLTSPAFLEIKRKDANGVGHKSRLMTDPTSIFKLLEDGIANKHIADDILIKDIDTLRQRYSELKPRIFIYYERQSLKNKQRIIGHKEHNVRVTIDSQLVFRYQDVVNLDDKSGIPLLDDDFVIMEIKAPAQKPSWLEDILLKHGLEEGKFSKYATAYHKTMTMAGQEV